MPDRRPAHPGDDPRRAPVRRGERGVTTTEAAVVMPALIVAIMLVFQVALLWHADQAVELAAEEAVETAQLADATANDGNAGADAVLSQVGHLHAVTVTVDRDDATGLVTVAVTGRAPRVVPFGTWAVHAVAQGNIERFVAAPDR